MNTRYFYCAACGVRVCTYTISADEVALIGTPVLSVCANCFSKTPAEWRERLK